MVSLGFKLFNDIQRLLVSSRQPLERLILALDVGTLGPGDAGLLAGADRLARLLGQDLEGDQGHLLVLTAHLHHLILPGPQPRLLGQVWAAGVEAAARLHAVLIAQTPPGSLGVPEYAETFLSVVVDRFVVVNSPSKHEQAAGHVVVEVLHCEDPADQVPAAGGSAGAELVLPRHVVPGLVHLGAAPGQPVHGVLRGAAEVGLVPVPEGEHAGNVGLGDAALRSAPVGKEDKEKENQLHSVYWSAHCLTGFKQEIRVWSGVDWPSEDW